MAHVYSAGGSRQAAVLTAIIGLHIAVLILVLNDQVPAISAKARDPGPVNVLPPKPAIPVPVTPDKVVLVEPYGPRVEKPDYPIPDFLPDAVAPKDPPAGGETKEGVLPSRGNAIDRMPASLQGISRDFAAVVRACYPAGPRRDGEEGLLKLAVTIAAGGKAQSWRVVQSTGFPRLDAAAQCVIDKLRFNAAREDGRGVQSEVLLPIVFRLD
jgi:protein TonB